MQKDVTDNALQLKHQSSKSSIMRTIINQSAILTKKNSIIDNFKNSKRIRWTDFGHKNEYSFY